MALKQDGVHFTPCPKHDHKIEGGYVIKNFFFLNTYTQIWSSTPPPGFTRSPHQEHNIPALKLGNSVIDLKNRLGL